MVGRAGEAVATYSKGARPTNSSSSGRVRRLARRLRVSAETSIVVLRRAFSAKRKYFGTVFSLQRPARNRNSVRPEARHQVLGGASNGKDENPQKIFTEIDALFPLVNLRVPVPS